eukprot:765025-Amphidinium_carterae.1
MSSEMGYLKLLRQKILDDAEEATKAANARGAGPSNATPAGGDRSIGFIIVGTRGAAETAKGATSRSQ